MPRMGPIGLRLVVGAGLALGCTDSGGPSGKGDLRVVTTTTGVSPDADGYVVRVTQRGANPANPRIEATGTMMVADLQTGSHQVRLVDVADNCTVNGANPQDVTIPKDDVVEAHFDIQCVTPPVGAIRVVTVTLGAFPDPDGYTVSLSSAAGQYGGHVPVNGKVVFDDVPVGNYQVSLTGLAPGCATAGATGTVTVHASVTTRVELDVNCTGVQPSSIIVTVHTSIIANALPDPDGYTVTLDAGTPRPVAVNGTVSFQSVLPGGHSVALGGLVAWCTPNFLGTNPVSVTVTSGQPAYVSFNVLCLP